MPQQTTSAVEQNFTKGLITEATGLNFPENAATQTQNCVYTLIGDVVRREGFNFEANATLNNITVPGSAVNSYKWNNVGGDGNTQIVVLQVGATLYYYRSSSASVSNPLSSELIATTNLTSFGFLDATQECQFTDGNGYLFVFHPTMDPVYITYAAGVLTPATILVQIRDLIGIPEPGITDNFRPSALTNEHQYNLQNQGWTAGNPWSATSSSSVDAVVGVQNFTIQTGLTIAAGTSVILQGAISGGSVVFATETGTVTSYTSVSGALVLAIGSVTGNGQGFVLNQWSITPVNVGYINTWVGAIGNYPSNADVWWYFKNSSGVFDPATTIANVTLGQGPAPKGHYIFPAFNQGRTNVSAVGALTLVGTSVRPSNGCWFQGRVWYTGVNASFVAQGDESSPVTWTENIYFSQIVQKADQFGKCYQTNDPTSQTLFNLLPTDGGVITIQGSGAIYKLFPLFNALLVFAANGVWYISGGSSVGFSATDYTIVKLSGVKSFSSTSFVDVNGLPIFWNEEGIYQVEPAKQGTQLLNSPLHVQPLEVNPLTVGTILTYYNNIPIQSKKYARGIYDPINYVVQWCFKTTNEAGISDRYIYDSILNFNTYNKAFYPYTFNITGGSTTPAINGIVYVSSPGGSTAPNSVFKYLTSWSNQFTFSEERDPSFSDWVSFNGGTNYVSDFVTGYKIRGQGMKRFQPQYVNVFSRTNSQPFGYTLQAIWDYANNTNSNRWSSIRYVNVDTDNYDVVVNRHKLRGRGYSVQFKISSITGKPFDVQGWSVIDNINQGA